MANELPTTVTGAVRVLLEVVPHQEQLTIATMDREGLFLLQFSVGTWIRSDFGLLDGNTLLISDTSETDIDQVSMVIIRAFWSYLRINGVRVI